MMHHCWLQQNSPKLKSRIELWYFVNCGFVIVRFYQNLLRELLCIRVGENMSLNILKSLKKHADFYLLIPLTWFYSYLMYFLFALTFCCSIWMSSIGALSNVTNVWNMLHALEKFCFVYGKTKQMYCHVEKIESVIHPSLLNTAGRKTSLLFCENVKVLQLVFILH